MIQVKYPEHKPEIRTTAGGQDTIFCLARNRWVKLTPEEWVRQNLISYLFKELGYPLSLMAVEKQIRVGEINRRFDLLVYDKNGQPYLVMECKETTVALSPSVLDQVLRYNIPIRAPYIFISNGIHCMGYATEGNHIRELDEFPLSP